MSEATKVQHTPGPWKAADTLIALGPDEVAIENEKGDIICGVWPFGEFEDTLEQDANAALIAAAPQLLAALKLAVRYIPSYRDGDADMMSTQEKINARVARELADAAIAKAER